jgi:hypothetical protein
MIKRIIVPKKEIKIDKISNEDLKELIVKIAHKLDLEIKKKNV